MTRLTLFAPVLPIALAAGLWTGSVLAVAGAEGDGDYELVVPGISGPFCVKSAKACAEAVEAIVAGRWLPVGFAKPAIPGMLPPFIPSCQAHPHCFSAESLTIRGYNDH